MSETLTWKNVCHELHPGNTLDQAAYSATIAGYDYFVFDGKVYETHQKMCFPPKLTKIKVSDISRRHVEALSDEWIKISSDCPIPDDEQICYVFVDGYRTVARWNAERHRWVDFYNLERHFIFETRDVTHWMPFRIPQIPG